MKQRRLKAFEVTLRVLGTTQQITPPPPGKLFRVLVRGIKLSVFGDTLPEKVIAIGGDGESQIGAEIGEHADEEKEARGLMREAAREAMKQAVDMTLAKLNLAGKRVKASAKSARKKR